MRVPSGTAQSTGGLARKPTRWASSAPKLLRRFGVRCSSEGRTCDDPLFGICRRTGIGRVRHLAVTQLWVQER
eukprot:2295114-Alexandrium_andersonii.AAC.1